MCLHFLQKQAQDAAPRVFFLEEREKGGELNFWEGAWRRRQRANLRGVHSLSKVAFMRRGSGREQCRSVDSALAMDWGYCVYAEPSRCLVTRPGVVGADTTLVLLIVGGTRLFETITVFVCGHFTIAAAAIGFVNFFFWGRGGSVGRIIFTGLIPIVLKNVLMMPRKKPKHGCLRRA